MLMISIIITSLTVIKFDFKAGIVSAEDFYLFSMIINKPYTKFG